MTDNVTNELLLEHLKVLRDDIRTAHDERVAIRDELRAIKGHISALTQSVAALVQSDLNRETQQGAVTMRLERIERRLDLVDENLVSEQ